MDSKCPMEKSDHDLNMITLEFASFNRHVGFVLPDDAVTVSHMSTNNRIIICLHVGILGLFTTFCYQTLNVSNSVCSTFIGPYGYKCSDWMSLCLKSIVFSHCQPTQTCKCVDLCNLVSMRQCSAVTMATNLARARAHTRISLPGLTFVHQHVDVLCEWHNIPLLSDCEPSGQQ